MALQGTIETFALPDVLRLLATSNKTGKLAVDGDRGLGALWVADGAIVASEIDLGTHPSTGSTEIQEGLFQILRFETGEFVFTADEAADHAGSPHDVESSITTSSAMLDELNQLTENVPSVSSYVSLSSQIDNPEVTLTADQWSVLSSVGGGTTVADIASDFSFGELDALRRVDDLLSEGVIDVSEASDASAAPVVADELVEEPNFDGEDASLVASDSEDPFAAEPSAPEASTSDEAVAEEDPFAAVAEESPVPEEAPVADESVVADPFASVEAEAADDSFAPVTEAADDPFAPVAEDTVDPFAAPEVDTSVVDAEVPSGEIIHDEIAHDEIIPDVAADTDAVDPFASVEETVGETLEEDSAGIDPFAPVAGAAAVGATGGVLHDVFGSSEADPDSGWEPAVAEDVTEPVAEAWPAPNVAGEVDADAPWSVDGVTEEATSQLPPPPAAMTPDGFDAPVAEEATSQLPPPPVMDDATVDGLEGIAADAEVDQIAESELPPPPVMDADAGPAFEAPDAEVSGVASFPEAPVLPPESPVASDTNDMARQLASLSPAAAQAVANAAKADTPAAREEALAEVEAEDSSVDRSLLMRFLGKSDKKDS